MDLRTHRHNVLLCLLLLLLPHRVSAGDVIAGPVQAEVLRIVDGDTLAVRALIWPGQSVRIKVRLAGVDAPELFHPHCPAERARAARARAFVRQHTGTSITLSAVHLGKYAGRVVARVRTSSGEDLSALLLQAGLARPVRGGAPWCS